MNIDEYYDKLQSSELKHHGIKGQKWGVRRYQNSDGTYTAEGKERRYSNKEIRLDEKNIKEEVRKTNPKIKKLEDENDSYMKQIDELCEKYDFDHDDGGGGTTDADQKAGEKYMDLWDKIDQNEQKIDAIVGKETTKQLIEKYGDERINTFNRQEGELMAAKAMLVLGSMAVGMFLFISHDSKK